MMLEQLINSQNESGTTPPQYPAGIPSQYPAGMTPSYPNEMPQDWTAPYMPPFQGAMPQQFGEGAMMGMASSYSAVT